MKVKNTVAIALAAISMIAAGSSCEIFAQTTQQSETANLTDQSSAWPSGAQKPTAFDSLSFGDRLTKLEARSGSGQAAPETSIIDRLTILEQKTFGQAQRGSIVERIKALESRPTGPTQVLLQTQAFTRPQQRPTQDLQQQSNIAPPAIPVSTIGSAHPSMAEVIKKAHVASVVGLPDIYPPRFFHVPPAGDDRPDRSDYLTNVLNESKNKVLKFQKMPIQIYITPIQEPGFGKAIREAFDDWNVRTAGLIKFVEVKSEKEARIIVVFNRLGLKPGNDCSLGAHTVTKWQARGPGRLAVIPVGAIPVPLYIPALGPKYTVPPQIIEVNLDVIYGHDDDVRLLLLKNIATHELGHALGMLGHSPSQSDMMYSVTDENSRLSQRDINTVTRLYQQKADIPL